MRSYSKKSRVIAAAGLALVMLIAAWVWAGVSYSAGTYAISADTSSVGGSGAWTTLGAMYYEEIANGDIASGGNLTLNAPAGYEFNTAAAVSAILFDGDGQAFKNMNERAIGGSFTIVKNATTITLAVATKSQGNVRNIVRWTGVQIRPTSMTPLNTNRFVTLSVPVGSLIPSDGVMATVSLTAGASKLFVAWPSQVFTSGTGVTGGAGTVTAGTSANLTLYAALDDNTIATAFNGTKTISYSGPASCNGSTPVYTTSVTFINGVANNVATTLFQANAATTITATTGTLTSVASSSHTVTPGTARTLVTLPGETFTVCAGNSGTPATQIIATAFAPTIRAVDAYYNLVTTVSGSKSMTYAGPTGTNAYNTPITFTSGVATTSATINTGQTTTLTATNTTDGTVALASSSFTVSANNVASFNVFDTITAAGATTGTIKTKVAGLNVLLDIVALNSGGTINSSFTGTVKVEVVDASAGGTCASWTPILTQNETFTVANAGRHRFTTPMNFTNVYKNVYIRVSYPVTSPTTSSCSSNNFAIRPSRYGVTVTDANWEAAGITRNLVIAFPATPATNGALTHKAGRPFRISATGIGETNIAMSNYSETPTLTLSACSTTIACPTVVGTVTPGTWTTSGGIAVTTTASVSEVGNFNLLIQDQTFAAVDAADSSTAERYISTSVTLGRFVPDHFLVSGAAIVNRSVTPGCAASNFTYMSEQFQASYTLTARNFNNDTTVNYTGAFAAVGSLARFNTTNASFLNFGAVDTTTPAAPTRLVAQIATVTRASPATVTTVQAHGLTTGSSVFLSGIGGIVGGATVVNNANFVVTVLTPTSFQLVGSNTSAATTDGAGGSASRVVMLNSAGTQWASGVSTINSNLMFNRLVGADGPFNAFQLGLLPVDLDGVSATGLNLNADNDATPTLERFRLGTTALRFGRMALRPAYGSHLLNLRVPAELQQFNGVGFVRNVDDNCTALVLGNLALSNWEKPTFSANLPQARLPANAVSANGVAPILVQRPDPVPTERGSALLTIDLLNAANAHPYLQGNWDNNAAFTSNPRARITFGNYNSTPVIYKREVF